MRSPYSLKPALAVLTSIFAGLFISGCIFTTQNTKPAEAKPATPVEQPASVQTHKKPTAVYHDFEDVLVPVEMSVVKDRTVIVSTPGFRSGILTLKGRVDSTSLYNFFSINMEKDNWQVISKIKSPETTIMVYHKTERCAVITIRDEQIYTYAEIGVAPTLGGGMLQKIGESDVLMDIRGKEILLGVTGGIAAYKAVELLRLFKKGGANVTVAMTEAAGRFVGKITFEVLSENPVLSNLWEDTQSSVTHIDVAEKADVAIIAPATANCIGKLAHGIADDALTTTMLALTCPVMICPSMNTHMYQNIRVQENLDSLEASGIHILDPDSGVLACKTVGTGRLPEPWFIFDRVCAMMEAKDLKGKNVLISAGPTVEAIDPVRYISNHSSGKMGYAIARAAENRGAKVTLVSGPVGLDHPVGVACIPVESCEQMANAMFHHLDGADIIIKVAAVADYRPVTTEDKKIKKTGEADGLTLELAENTDILKAIGQRKGKDQFLVGFAAETNDLEAHAMAKMKKKNLDMIAANLVGGENSGFKADTNKVKLFSRDGNTQDIPLMDKNRVAHIILDAVLKQMG